MLKWFIRRFDNRVQSRPSIVFGRYSDNNKTIPQVSCWTAAEALFREKKFRQSIEAFFHYLRDDHIKNVETMTSDSTFHFTLYQGSKVVRGVCDDHRILAEVTIARMSEPSIPVMRRLLEQNFNLYYTRYTLDNDRIYMRFDSELKTANPNKLYYGLKELAIKADKQDDLLVEDFTMLKRVDVDHVNALPEEEVRIRLYYFRKFIDETLSRIDTLEKEKLATAISYMLLALGYRIDYLISPEGKLLQELERVIAIYFTHEEISLQEKIHLMINGFKNLKSKSDDEVKKFLFRSVSTFSIVSPQPHKVIAERLNGILQNTQWYIDNKLPEMAQHIMEYGFAFCQYAYSLPKPLSRLFQLFMEVLYPDYFTEFGFPEKLYDKGVFNKRAIEWVIDEINRSYKEKYPKLLFKKQQLRYDDLTIFAQCFLREVVGLNFDIVK
ncbi:MAG: hypothetical protein ACK45S_04190 [Sphingobacteriales bacterium]|jgi:hypothetical protein